MPGIASGTRTRRNVARYDTPRHHEASSSLRSTAANPAATGWTVNGRLYSTDATSRP